MNSSRPVFETAAWFAAFGLLAFFPILFLGQAYDGSDLLYYFAPFRQFLRSHLLQGVLPLWNPFTFAGQPFFADIQTQLLYPPNYLTLLPSVATGMSWYLVLHWLIAALGMRQWLRTLKISEEAARIGGLIFALSGFFWWEINHPPVIAAFAWIPWWFAALEKAVRQPSVRVGWCLGAAYAMLFLSGSFQVTLGATYAGVSYAIVRFFGRDRKQHRPTPRVWATAFLAALLGGSPLVLQLNATGELSKLSVRERAGKDYARFNADWSLQPRTVGQFLLPRLGLPQDKTIETAIQEVTGDDGQPVGDDNVGNDYLANFGYLGVWLPLLVLFAFRERQGTPTLLLGVLAVLALLLSFGKHFFLHSLLCGIAPGFSWLRTPFRFLFLYVLPASALAALGYQALARERPQPEERRFRRTVMLAFGTVALLLALTDPANCTSEILAILLVVAGALLLERDATVRWGRSILFLGLALPLVLSGWGTFRSRPASNLDLIRNAPWLDFVKSKAGNERVWLDQRLPFRTNTGRGIVYVSAPNNASCVWGLKVPTGYNPLRLQAFADVSSLPFLTYAKLTAIRRIVLTRAPPGDLPGYTLVVGRPLAVLESTEARPAVYAPSRWEVVEERASRLAFMRKPDFNPYQKALLDHPLPAGYPLPDFDTPPAFTGSLVSETANHQAWRIESSAPLIAVFSDSNYPGWTAKVDGRITPVLSANHGFRALHLEDGRHEVEFTFRPMGASLIAPILLSWLFSIAALLVWEAKCRARARSLTRSE